MRVEMRDAILLIEAEVTQIVFEKNKESPEMAHRINVAWKNLKIHLEEKEEKPKTYTWWSN
tara:strand:- start:25223 stop:25405 length:183 start_codon:yes stop_codon:yes gene_type:complete